MDLKKKKKKEQTRSPYFPSSRLSLREHYTLNHDFFSKTPSNKGFMVKIIAVIFTLKIKKQK